jgi:hypothetical protein
MLFGNRNHHKNCKITINNNEVERVHVTKFLGVLIDENFNWKDHIKLVKSKLSKCLAIVYRAKCILDRNSLIILYCSLFLPYLTYCSEVWANTFKSNIRPIVIQQKKVIRLISNEYRIAHTNPLFLKHKLLKFDDIVQLKTAIVMFKAKNNMLPSNLQNLFSLGMNSKRETRQHHGFKQKYVRTKIKSMCISLYVVLHYGIL